MNKILSTKKLSVNLKQMVLNSGLSLVDVDFIKVKNLHFTLSELNKTLIFTSKNAVLSVLESKNLQQLNKIECICVGVKTKQLLEQYGFKVIESFINAEELAQYIYNNNSKSYTFFSGKIRLNTIPEALKNASVKYNEVTIYNTSLTSCKIDSILNGILFFSPSGVASYLKNNKINKEICFCIGKTTAKALESKTTNIVIAEKPSVENVIAEVIEYYKN